MKVNPQNIWSFALNSDFTHSSPHEDSACSYPSQDETGFLGFFATPSSGICPPNSALASSDKSSSVYIIIPCYNRKQTTLACLNRLEEQGVMTWARIVVIDDASPDETGAAVEKHFPDVKVLNGDGDLWWAGGINKGIEYALKQGADLLFWLNDDCRPRDENSIRRLLEFSTEHQCIAVGQAVCPSGYFYGGSFKKVFGRSRHIFCPPRETMPCDIFSGNAVCVPRAVIEEIGLLDAEHFPMMADADYGLRALMAGRKAVVVGDALFDSDENTSLEDQSLLLSAEPWRKVWNAKFYSVKSSMYLPAYTRLSLKHWGGVGWLIVGGMLLKHVIYLFLRLLLPRKLLIRLFGSVMRTWR